MSISSEVAESSKTPEQIAIDTKAVIESALVLDPYIGETFDLANLKYHPDMEPLFAMVKKAQSGRDATIGENYTLQQLTFALLRCKFSATGKWIRADKCYRLAYDNYTMSQKTLEVAAQRLERLPKIKVLIDQIRTRVLEGVVDRVENDSVGVKANRIRRMSESWERLRQSRDKILPPEPVESRFETPEAYKKAFEEWEEAITRATTVWSLELGRIEKTMGEIEDRVAEELGQRQKMANLNKNQKGYVNFDPSEV